MSWEQLAKRIKEKIIPGNTAILKCSGDDRRPVTSNDGAEIGMRCGVTTIHSISYGMIHYAYDVLQETGKFDSEVFRKRFQTEYDNATCRYSMTGGVLVALKVADRITTGRNRCGRRRRPRRSGAVLEGSFHPHP